MKTIYFVRHGQSQANLDGFYAGSRIDCGLTTKGLEQARLTAQILKGKKFDVIVSSPMLRARTTADVIAQKLGYDRQIITEPLLTERDFGVASGRPWSEAEVEIDNGTAEELETIDQLAARMQKVLEWFGTVPGESILVVGHGTAEMMLQTIYQRRLPKDFLQTKELGNSEIREYVIDKE